MTTEAGRLPSNGRFALMTGSSDENARGDRQVPDHPVRHGAAAAAFLRTMGLWWGDLLSSLREQAARRAR